MSEENNNNNNNNAEHEDEAAKDPKVTIQQLFQKRAQSSQQNSKVVTGDVGEKRSLFKDYTDKSTIYFKNNRESMYHIDRDCTKVLIEGCANCRIVFNARVKTEVVEIWKCENLEIITNKATIKTLQVDISKNVNISFKDKAQFQEMIWAGVNSFNLAIGNDKISSGLDEVLNSEKYEKYNISPETDQFIVRYVEGELLQELIVRLENGFPTTDREADAFAERKKKNDVIYENFIRSLLSKNDVAKDLAVLDNIKQEKGEEVKDEEDVQSENKENTSEEVKGDAKEELAN